MKKMNECLQAVTLTSDKLEDKRRAVDGASEVISDLISRANWYLQQIDDTGTTDRASDNYREPEKDTEPWDYWRYEMYVIAINAIRDYIDKM